MPQRPCPANRSLQLLLALALVSASSACYVDLDGDDGTNRDGWIDTDGDGIPDTPPDAAGMDSDNDTISDLEEGSDDPDGDGLPNSLDDDSDGDGIPDVVEAGDDDPSTPPVDTDGDGIPDYLDTDSDGDGVADLFEGLGDPDGDGLPSYLDTDSDNDGIEDKDEIGPDPGAPLDSDGDGYYNFEDSDSDNDGIRDGMELAAGTSLTERDTDGDGFTDLAEQVAGSDPLDHGSVIEGYYVELSAREQHRIDVPFTPAILQADVLFVLDATCSMQDVLNSMASNFGQVVSGVSIPDVNFGVAEFEDYAYADMGSPGAGDRPFILRQQITSDTNAVQTSLSDLTIHNGIDNPESSIEALFQAATGQGFDQDCTNSYYSSTDVRPFIADGMDAFGGNVDGSFSPTVTGTGTRGGAGFRDGSVPIIVYTTDNLMRDSGSGYNTPPGCSNPASAADVAGAIEDIGGKLIAVGTNNTPIPQMQNLATLTDSVADIDGNGTSEPLVFTGSSSATVGFVLDGIEAIAGSGTFDLKLDIDQDPYTFVASVDPPWHGDVPVNTEVVFELTIVPAVTPEASDQVFLFPMQVLTDSGAVLGEWDLVLVLTP